MNAHKKLVLQLSTATVGMFIFGFALVPLYDVFCEITGLNGKVELVASNSSNGGIDISRSITVQFIANTNENMPWDFVAKDREVILHPGANGRAMFSVKNNAANDMVGQAIVSVSPSIGAKHFHKTECFCFERQELKSGESEDVGLVFSIDPDLPASVTKITLSYTFFDITELVATR